MAHVRKQQISFFMTAACNLACKYCYTLKNAIRKEHQFIDVEFAKAGIDDYFRESPSREIRFYGAGEPTLAFKQMKEIRDYAFEQAGDSLKVELQTNGYFGREVRDWVAKNVDILWISCDGPPAIQDEWRPTRDSGATSKIVEDNIRFFSSLEGIQAGVRMTVNPKTVDLQSGLIDYFHSLGIKYVCGEAIVAEVSKPPNLARFVDPVRFANGFADAYFHAKRLGICYQCLPMCNFDENVDVACSACLPCPRLTTDGYVSCCDLAQFGPEYSPGPLQQLIYGKHERNAGVIIYDEEKIRAIRSRNAGNLLKRACSGCGLVSHCAGGCAGQAVNETGDLLGVKPWSCEVTKRLAVRLLPMGEPLPVRHS